MVIKENTSKKTMIANVLKGIARRIPFIRGFFKVGATSKSEGFIRLENALSGKHIWMFLRKDCYMEKEFQLKGLFGNWEKESLKIWAALSQKSSYILDVGANTGIYSLIAKSQNPFSNVFSVEPIDVNFVVLCRNIEKNGFDINAEKVALSSNDGFAKMFMLKDRLNYMTSVNDNRYERHPEIKGGHEVVEIQVPIRTYQYLKDKYKIPKLDLIKIDVEGHEVDVLRPMFEYIKEDKPAILIEVIGEENARVLNEFFLKLGYSFISIDEVKKSFVVEKLWDNDHHNFLVCDVSVIKELRNQNLVI